MKKQVKKNELFFSACGYIIIRGINKMRTLCSIQPLESKQHGGDFVEGSVLDVFCDIKKKGCLKNAGVFLTVNDTESEGIEFLKRSGWEIGADGHAVCPVCAKNKVLNDAL